MSDVTITITVKPNGNTNVKALASQDVNQNQKDAYDFWLRTIEDAVQCLWQKRKDSNASEDRAAGPAEKRHSTP